ncbi:adenylate/guanylate cyclase domain-containing protein [Azospirillum sp. ST 5-10]|uniref:adenylate/guanylate cyclase domain-containing protein n=1 Tax=unclassified Azospirillum TaxID=2630922 RepID=UPI003F4A1EAC
MIDWLLTDGRRHTGVPEFIDALCRHLRTVGVPLARCSLALTLLHPQIRSMSYYWRVDLAEVEAIERAHGIESSIDYLTSPVAAIMEQGAEALRFRLERMAPPWPYPVVGELQAQGYTDYAVMTLRFSDGRPNMASFATDQPGGFTTADLAAIDAMLPAMGAVLETMVLRRLATTVLDTYVGRRTGARILSGDIRRGTGAALRAVLWQCDLRGFTALADRLPREELIALLNGYFEVMGGAVEARDGEILKFIGDALLAVFPLPDAPPDAPCGAECDREACTRALDAAEAALAGMARLNAERAAWGQPVLHCGIALHLGDVMYGNIGAPSRLDFTVIGPAVNLVSRLESLCKRLERPVLASAAVAAACGDRMRSLGWHPVRGLRDPVEVFALAADPTP